MTQIGKLNDMFYEIKGNNIQLEVVRKLNGFPNTHISQNIETNTVPFWKFVLEIIVEAKEDYLEIIRNEEGDYIPQTIEKATQQLKYLRNIEKAVEFMIPPNRVLGV